MSVKRSLWLKLKLSQSAKVHLKAQRLKMNAAKFSCNASQTAGVDCTNNTKDTDLDLNKDKSNDEDLESNQRNLNDSSINLNNIALQNNNKDKNLQSHSILDAHQESKEAINAS